MTYRRPSRASMLTLGAALATAACSSPTVTAPAPLDAGEAGIHADSAATQDARTHVADAISAEAAEPERDANVVSDARPRLPCDLPGKTFDVNGESGYVLADIQGAACAGTVTCNAPVALPPYCGDEAAALDDYTCTCSAGRLHCVLTYQGGGIASSTGCDGGPGTDDAGG